MPITEKLLDASGVSDQEARIRRRESSERGSGGLDLGLNPLALRSMLSRMGL
jgi:hypothetical protein